MRRSFTTIKNGTHCSPKKNWRSAERPLSHSCSPLVVDKVRREKGLDFSGCNSRSGTSCSTRSARNVGKKIPNWPGWNSTAE